MNQTLRRLAIIAFAGIAISFMVSSSHAGEDGWISLFDGKSLKGWAPYKGKKIGDAWVVQDGMLHLKGAGGGTIITKKQFDNFILEFDWKISPGGNSGIMYRVRKGDKAAYFSGPEYQILDNDKHRDGKNPKTSAAALYAMVPAKDGKLQPVGEWNKAKIVLKGSHLEHWLNGKKVVDIEINGPRWKELVNASKFKTWEPFGQMKKGHIAFQDHGDPVWYRNIRLKPLPAKD